MRGYKQLEIDILTSVVTYNHWDDRGIKVMIVTIQFITEFKSHSTRTHNWGRIGYLIGDRHERLNLLLIIFIPID